MSILIINGHPDLNSFTSQLAKRKYDNIHSTNKDVTLLNIAELEFDIFYKGFSEKKSLEPDLIEAQSKIKNAEHIILFTPIWWSTYPALLKGFFDKVLQPNFAFKYQKGKAMPEKLLTGRTAEIVLLSDAPSWIRKYLMQDPAAKILKRDILGFCGIKVKKVRRIGAVSSISVGDRERIIDSI